MISEQEWLDGVKIAVIGLGYVGLPLAVEFGKQFPVVGFDINKDRIRGLQGGIDDTLETDPEELKEATGLRFTDSAELIDKCNVYIVTVPTPIDASRRPDLRPLISACDTVGRVLKRGDTVIFESTVYPGCTEEDCVPVIERVSGLVFNRDFTVGYSPERINPGDKTHRLPNICKVTSGSTAEAAERIDALYGKIIAAGTHKAATIRIAEAAKIIENTQRDINIALINELAIIFNKLGIDTKSVLEAAGTKWNFLPFRPGLVGGHCIGVDPYYLTHKAQTLGYNPEIILAGRRLNDGMSQYVAEKMILAMIKKGIQILGSRVLVLGFTFKENCPDIRNSKVADLVSHLVEFGVQVDVHDPWVDASFARTEYNIDLVSDMNSGHYDGIIFAVAHDVFKENAQLYREYGNADVVIYDLKGCIPSSLADLRL